MNKIKIFLSIVFVFAFSTFSNAQQIIPKFRKLQFVTYTGELNQNKRSVNISDIINIDQNGQVHYVASYDLDNYYLDTTFQASNELITSLNNIFNSETSLESQRDTSRMPGVYEGPLVFITYIDEKGKTDDVSFVNGYMDKEFNQSAQQLRSIPYPTKKHPGEIYHDKPLQTKVFKFYMACKYIPKLTHPAPTVRSLIIADPGVKH